MNSSDALLLGVLSGGPKCPLPLAGMDVSAGFPSPAEDFIDKAIDLNDLLIKRPAATFLLRCSGQSMVGAGIDSGDLLIVDRSETATSGTIVVAMYDGEFTLKRYISDSEGVRLAAENPEYPDIKLQGESELQIFGVLRHVIKSYGL